MFKMMFNIISKPQLSFTKKDDNKGKIFGYLFILALIMSLPLFLMAIIRPRNLFIDNQTLNGKVEVFLDEGIEISNYKLNNNGVNKSFVVDQYIFAVGELEENHFGMVMTFEEDGIKTAFNLMNNYSYEIDFIPYDQLLSKGYLSFDEDNKTQVVNLIYKNFEKNTIMILVIANQEYIFNFINLLLITLILAALASFRKRMPLKFSEHFNVNAYIVTIYAFVYLILKLFSLHNWDFIGILAVYIYHFIAYRSVIIIRTKKGD